MPNIAELRRQLVNNPSARMELFNALREVNTSLTYAVKQDGVATMNLSKVQASTAVVTVVK